MNLSFSCPAWTLAISATSCQHLLSKTVDLVRLLKR